MVRRFEESDLDSQEFQAVRKDTPAALSNKEIADAAKADIEEHDKMIETMIALIEQVERKS
jgi:BRCT domain type II-containing protein